MASTVSVGDAGPALLSKERSSPSPASTAGWCRRPPSCIHLCIGMAYGFSVFWMPLQGALVGTDGKPLPSARGRRDLRRQVAGTLTRSPPRLQLEPVRPRLDVHAVLRVPRRLGRHLGRLARARRSAQGGVVSALCWCGGLLISAVGVYLHQLWLMWLGSGVIGGIGLGLGYISPVSTLIKWFPDRRGMATGMAIMGFGGGAMIGSPLATC